jgi:hypothetical protein
MRHLAPQSIRNASIGSVEAARRAGHHAAKRPIKQQQSENPAIMTGRVKQCRKTNSRLIQGPRPSIIYQPFTLRFGGSNSDGKSFHRKLANLILPTRETGAISTSAIKVMFPQRILTAPAIRWRAAFLHSKDISLTSSLSLFRLCKYRWLFSRGSDCCGV